MLKDEIDLMLSSLMNNRKALKKFYKTGYFSYHQDKSFKGAVAIVNDKAIVSFLQDVDDDSKVIATATFQNNTTIIIQLNGDYFSRTQFGKLPERCISNREAIISDISLLRGYCAEAEERLTSGKSHFIRSIFSKKSQSSDRKLSKQDVRFMLETTLDKLHETLTLNNRSEVSPRVNTTISASNTTSNINPSINDKTPEISSERLE